MEKTCNYCVWGKDECCHKPNRNPHDTMADCFLDPLEVKELLAKQVSPKSWNGIKVNGIPVDNPIWEDTQTCKGCKHLNDSYCEVHNEPVADEFVPINNCYEF